MSNGDSHWVFESSDPNTRVINATDKKFFWLSLYATPALWIGLAILAIVRLQNVIWLSLVGEFSAGELPLLFLAWQLDIQQNTDTSPQQLPSS